ncbi:hypothetical protein [Pseudomonas sp. SO81]|uniref:hypothetical protein n=1 Tax=Pseudomonas sp. SO81 TaxID=2983246 RepID=UPI0025A338CF|nr:hypothetical protein [Pseudomonas sp. SO81]WJN61347.1 hypothetical protein OH686_21600 [Pseudomonas sp. SO81]
MSKRKTYRPDELRAGRTVFIVTRVWLDHTACKHEVAEYLIAGKHEPQPQPNEVHPYRTHPKVAQYAATVTDLWRTRRAALREAARRQAALQAHISRRSA